MYYIIDYVIKKFLKLISKTRWTDRAESVRAAENLLETVVNLDGIHSLNKCFDF